MRISIITPTFNREECIIRCLDSVTCQLDLLPGDVEVEHVVVDDGSTDASADIVRNYARGHHHIIPVFFEKNRGVNAARNAAIQTASGDWCLLLDSDDRLVSTALKDITDTVKSNPGYLSYMFTVDDRENEFKAYPNHKVFTFDDFLSGSISGDFAHFLKRDLMLRHRFDESLRIYEGLFFLCFYKEAGKMLFSNIVTHLIERNRDDSVSLTFVRYDDSIIHRKAIYARMNLDLFEQDYRAHNLDYIVEKLHFDIADNALLLNDYSTAGKHLKYCGKSVKTRMLSLIIHSHTGKIYKWLLQRYLDLKHRRPTRGVN